MAKSQIVNLIRDHSFGHNLTNDASGRASELAHLSRIIIFENIPCHIMEYSWYTIFPHGKFQVMWQII
jgi:hypothetical protein